MNVVIEVLGWVGAAMVLCAYFLSSRDIWPASTVRSAALNIGGAGLLTLNAGYHGAIPSAALNVVWIGIGMATLTRVLRVSGGNQGA